jgi:myo-inositol-1(or 4)-monophosphatase
MSDERPTASDQQIGRWSFVGLRSAFLKKDDYAELLTAATETAVAAGQLLRERWQQPQTLTSKGFRDWVTESDVAIQRFITDRIGTQFPDHGFLVEEKDAGLPESGRCIWIIDPIDGTNNFSRQQPNFCTSIAVGLPAGRRTLVEAAPSRGAASTSSAAGYLEVVTGAVYDPLRDELFTGLLGGGSYLNGRRLQVSQTAELGQAIIALDWSSAPEERRLALSQLARTAHNVLTMRAIGSATLAIAWVAAGRLDGYWHNSLKAWDAAAATLFVHEAGGLTSNGRRLPWQTNDGRCVASNKHLHEQLLALLAVENQSQ